MSLKTLTLAAMMLGAQTAHAQPQQGDVRLDSRDIRVCARTGCVAGGDTLASEIARAQQAEAARVPNNDPRLCAAGAGAAGGCAVLDANGCLILNGVAILTACTAGGSWAFSTSGGVMRLAPDGSVSVAVNGAAAPYYTASPTTGLTVGVP